MSRQTRKTDPDKAIAKTHGGGKGKPETQFRNMDKHTAGKGGNTISQGEDRAKDQWGIGSTRANSFRDKMREYDSNRRNPDPDYERHKPPSQRKPSRRSV